MSASPLSTFTPYFSLITGITNGQAPIVTFSADHQFTVGEYISFRVSKPYGMTLINNLKALVESVTPTTLTIDLDTTFFQPFVYPPVGTVTYPAMAVPAGSGIIPNSNPATVTLEDVFDNVPLN
jgi:hypothetical protein